MLVDFHGFPFQMIYNQVDFPAPATLGNAHVQRGVLKGA